MEASKIDWTLLTYDTWLIRLIPHAGVFRQHKGDTLFLKVEHLRWMIHEAQQMVSRGNLEKALRWMGFIEGSLVQLGIVTLEEIQVTDILGYVPDGKL